MRAGTDPPGRMPGRSERRMQVSFAFNARKPRPDSRGLLPLDFLHVFAYADSDVLRNSETKAVRGGVQTMPAGRACRCSSIPFSVNRGRLPSVRRAAPVSPL